MLAKTKKFLWFDITPRKNLYDEIDRCYERIEYLVAKVNKLKDEKRDLQDIIESKTKKS